MSEVKQLVVRDFGRIADTTIDLAKVTVVAGPNLAGKTTLVRAIEYGLTGRTAGLAANESRLLVRDGRDRLRVELTLATTRGPQKVARTLTTVDPKQGEIDALLPSRTQVLASLYSTQFVRMSVADRREFLRGVIGPPEVTDPLLKKFAAMIQGQKPEPPSFGVLFTELQRRLALEEANAATPVAPVIDQDVPYKGGLVKASALPTAEAMEAGLKELRARPQTASPAQALVEFAMEDIQKLAQQLASAKVRLNRVEESQPAEDAAYAECHGLLTAAAAARKSAERAVAVAEMRRSLSESVNAWKGVCRICEGPIDQDAADVISAKAVAEASEAMSALGARILEERNLEARVGEFLQRSQEYDHLRAEVTTLTESLAEAEKTRDRAASSASMSEVEKAQQVVAAIYRGEALLAARRAYDTSVEQNRMGAKSQETSVRAAGELRAALSAAEAVLKAREVAAIEIIRAALREASAGMFFGNESAVQLTDGLGVKIIDRDARIAGRSAVERAGIALAYAVAHLSPFGTLVIDDAEMMDKLTLQHALGFLARQTTIGTVLVCVVEADKTKLKAPSSPLVAMYWAECGVITRLGKAS